MRKRFAIWMIPTAALLALALFLRPAAGPETMGAAEMPRQLPLKPDEIQPESANAPPVFDIVRIEANGSAIIAGQAFGEGPVEILLDGVLLAEAPADASGRFVIFPRLPPSEQPRRLTLRQDAQMAVATVLVAPIAAPQTDLSRNFTAFIEPADEARATSPTTPKAPFSEATPSASADIPSFVMATPTIAQATVLKAENMETPKQEPPAGTSDDTRIDAADPTPPVALASLPVPQELPEPRTPQILILDEDGLRAPSAAAPNELHLQTIGYSPTGDLTLSGNAPGRSLRLYLDNRPLTDVPLRPGGQWDVALPQVVAGIYTLRIDALDSDGKVVSRVETPFRRQDPEEIAAVMADQTTKPNFDVAVVTVQPGHSLWAIAEATYGDGVRYVELYRANRDLIRDPDLIYPGQIFRLPKGD